MNADMKIGYIRISNKDESPIRQIAALAMENCDRVVEEQLPHLVKKRPELETLLKQMQFGDTLVVWGFERIACSALDLKELIAKLNKRGITLHSIKEKFVSSSERAAPMLDMLNSLVNLRALVHAEHSAVVQKTIKEKGIKIGVERKLSDRDMQMIFALIDEGIHKNAIAKKFGISEKNLNKWLRDPRYMGEVIQRPRRNPNLRQRLRTKDAPVADDGQDPMDHSPRDAKAHSTN